MATQQSLVVFDWNGTLLDDADISMGGMNAILDVYGRDPIGIDRFRETYDIPITRYYRNLGFSDAEIAAHDYKMTTIFHDYYNQESIRAPLVSGAAQALRALRDAGARVIVLSNHVVASIAGHMDRLGIADLIDDVIAFEDVRVQTEHIFIGNPNRQTKGDRLVRFIADRGFDPARAAIVGDTPEETHIARQQGLYSVAITGGYASRARLEQVAPDVILDHLADLPRLLHQRGLLAGDAA